MSTTRLIYPGFVKDKACTEEVTLKVSELFTDAIQGEGEYAGYPATFLRLAGCPVNCEWCDSRNIWTKTTSWRTGELLDFMEQNGVLEKLKTQHLVITGGSPLLQQNVLTEFFQELAERCDGWYPFIEIENEASLSLEKNNVAIFNTFVSWWNISPKLNNSGIPVERRYNPKALEQLSDMVDILSAGISYKFVVNGEEDWDDIQKNYIDPGYIFPSQIILMPCGCSREELTPEKKAKIIDMAVNHGVRFGGRIQIDVYDKKEGV